MICYWYTTIKYEPHRANGGLREKNLRVRSKTMVGALQATAKIAKEEGLEARKIEVHPEGIPVSKTQRLRVLRERREAQEQERQDRIDALMAMTFENAD